MNDADSSSVNAILDGSGANGCAALGDSFVDNEKQIGSALGGDLLFGDGGTNELKRLSGNDLIQGRTGSTSSKVAPVTTRSSATAGRT